MYVDKNHVQRGSQNRLPLNVGLKKNPKEWSDDSLKDEKSFSLG